MSKFNNSNKYKYRLSYFNNKHKPKNLQIRSNRYKYRYNYFKNIPKLPTNNQVNNQVNNDDDFIDITQLFNLPFILPQLPPMPFFIENNQPNTNQSNNKSVNTKKNKLRDASDNSVNSTNTKKPKLSEPSKYGNKSANVAPNVSVISISRKDGKPTPNLFSIVPEINKILNEITLSKEKDKNNEDDKNKKEEKKVTPLELTKEEETYPFEIIDKKIETIKDLIQLGQDYEKIYKPMKKRFNLNIRVLAELVEPLQDLENMIGMGNIKKSIFNKIIMYLQGLENRNKDFLHTVICGSPGMGKTDVAKIIGRIYSKMGFLSNGKFVEAKLTDLKAGFLGQSEMKTQKLLDDCKGSVLFFDEAYSLGASDDKIDSYSQGIIDILNPYMDKYKDDFVLIIAGYKDDLLKRFFKGNQGLRSRFGLWLEIDKYKSNEMRAIFIKKVLDYGWKIKEDEINNEFFEKNKDEFKYFGRDMENLFAKCKIAHATRVLYSDPSDKKIINKTDLEKGFKIYKSDLDVTKNDGISDYIRNHMFL